MYITQDYWRKCSYTAFSRYRFFNRGMKDRIHIRIELAPQLAVIQMSSRFPSFASSVCRLSQILSQPNISYFCRPSFLSRSCTCTVTRLLAACTWPPYIWELEVLCQSPSLFLQQGTELRGHKNNLVSQLLHASIQQ